MSTKKNSLSEKCGKGQISQQQKIMLTRWKKKVFAFIVEKDFRNLSIKYVHASRSLPLEMLATHFVQLYIATSNLLKINKSQQSATKAVGHFVDLLSAGYTVVLFLK